MSIFTKFGKTRTQTELAVGAASGDEAELLAPSTVEDRHVKRATSRTKVYAVRVGNNFKGEMLGVQAELQLERNKLQGNAKKVTEGEIIERMLQTFKVALRNGNAAGNAVPIANDVWQGVHTIAGVLKCSPVDVIEQLVVAKVAELDLLPRK
jgi:hypothetical protein